MKLRKIIYDEENLRKEENRRRIEKFCKIHFNLRSYDLKTIYEDNGENFKANPKIKNIAYYIDNNGKIQYIKSYHLYTCTYDKPVSKEDKKLLKYIKGK